MLTDSPFAGALGSCGQVVWIGLRPARRQPVVEVEQAEALLARGLRGDRATARFNPVRQVTLVDEAQLAAVARELGISAIAPGLVRRNLLVRGLDLSRLRGATLQVGQAVLEVTGPCDPCQRMEEALGAGALDAMRDAGGLTARVVAAGWIRQGDAVRPLDSPSL